VLARSPLDGTGLAAELRPFWGDGEVSLGQVTGELIRRRMAEGVSGPEYETTVAVLRRMAANLEGGPPA
jgi:hypothetical protein